MSIEKYLESAKNKPSTFKKVAGKLLAEKESKDTRPFVWEDEVGEKEWKEMEDVIEANLEDPNPEFIAGILSSMRVLDPDRPLHIDENKWEILEDQLKEHKKQRDWAEFAIFAQRLHLIDPSRSIDIDATVWKKIESRLEWSGGHDEFMTYMNLFMCIYLLDPNRTLPNKEDNTEEMKLELQESINNNKPIDHIAHIISMIRLLDPQYKPELDESVWSQMEKLLYTQKSKGHYWQYCDLASRMRIIAAHKVEVTKDGIIITDDPLTPLDVAIPPRPVRKRV